MEDGEKYVLPDPAMIAAERVLSTSVVILLYTLRNSLITTPVKPSYSRDTDDIVVTSAPSEGGAKYLPRTGVLIRGVDGVMATVSRVTLRPAYKVRWNALVDKLLYIRKREDASNLATALDEFLQVIWSRSRLAMRLFDAVGYKHYEFEELQQIIAEKAERRENMIIFSIIEIIATAFPDDLVDLATASEAIWEAAVGRTLEVLINLEQQEFYDYQALAYLNAPLVDIPSVDLGIKASGGAAVLLPASDELLRHAIESSGYIGSLPPGVQESNAVIVIPVLIPVDSPVEHFLSVYPGIAGMVRKLVDALRLVYDSEIGVAALRVVAKDILTPAIRRTHSRMYEPDYAPYYARRTAYWSSEPVLVSGEALELKKIVKILMQDDLPEFVNTALTRFRNSIERYQPEDPERLLDIAIAFEALILNDGDNKELRFRLALRLARWVAPPGDERHRVFRSIQDLYDLRSKIAHGTELKPSERACIESMLVDITSLLRSTLCLALLEKGPPSAKQEASQWWRAVELS